MNTADLPRKTEKNSALRPIKERPVIFTGDMVRAIFEDRKWQTRRIINPQPPYGCDYAINGAGTHALCFAPGQNGTIKAWVPPTAKSTDHRLACPYGEPADRLWVKETFWENEGDVGVPHFVYRADGRPGIFRWKPPIFMPRRASRITLEIVRLGVERLQDITEDDAKAEGVPEDKYQVHYYCDEGDPNDPNDFGEHRCNWRFGYKMVWQHINGKTHPWESNPWVWVITFRRL